MRYCAPRSSPARMILERSGAKSRIETMRTAALLAAAVVLSFSASALVQTTNPLPVTTSADLAFVSAMSELHVASNGANQYALWRDASFRWFAVELTRDGQPIVATQRLLADRALAIWRNDNQTASGALIDGAGHVTNYFAGVVGSFDQPALASNGTDAQLLWYGGDGMLFSMTLNESAGDPNTRNVVASNAI